MTPRFLSLRRTGVRPFAFAALFLCAGCGKVAESPPADASTASAAAAAPLPPGSAPIAGVIPQPAEDKPASGVAGPAAGNTAIGGLAGKQDSGGQKDSAGTGSAPTGGDGAASAAR